MGKIKQVEIERHNGVGESWQSERQTVQLEEASTQELFSILDTLFAEHGLNPNKPPEFCEVLASNFDDVAGVGDGGDDGDEGPLPDDSDESREMDFRREVVEQAKRLGFEHDNGDEWLLMDSDSAIGYINRAIATRDEWLADSAAAVELLASEMGVDTSSMSQAKAIKACMAACIEMRDTHQGMWREMDNMLAAMVGFGFLDAPEREGKTLKQWTQALAHHLRMASRQGLHVVGPDNKVESAKVHYTREGRMEQLRKLFRLMSEHVTAMALESGDLPPSGLSDRERVLAFQQWLHKNGNEIMPASELGKFFAPESGAVGE